MNNSPLEFLAQKYGNVVKYDKDGTVAGIFVKFPKMKSKDLVAGLPDHVHPAFKVNGSETDYILFGKFKGGDDGSGIIKSLPNIPPVRSMGADQCLEGMKNAGDGITGATVADYGFIKLLAQKNGWAPKGNTFWGQSHKDGTAWENAKSVTVGTERAYEGYIYKCLIAHTTSPELKPDIAPAYWQKGKYIGGVSYDTAKDTARQTGYRTLNGTGPLDWYLGEDVGNVADIIGSSMEQQHGYRLVNCELQILPDNNAADPSADLSANSSAWRAILPNKSNDGYTLVAPGTAGTLHWNYVGGAIVLDTQTDTYDNACRGCNFRDLKANTSRLPYVPYIVKELGLFPTGSDDKTEGYYYLQFTKDERFPRRGGHYPGTGDSGLGYVHCNSERGDLNAAYGCRPRSR